MFAAEKQGISKRCVMEFVCSSLICGEDQIKAQQAGAGANLDLKA